MPFQRKCASSKLHTEWQITEDSSLANKVTAAVRDKLLHLCDIDPKHSYHKRLPKFCRGCIAKVSELYPEVTVTNEKEPHNKRTRFDFQSDPGNVLECDDAISN